MNDKNKTVTFSKDAREKVIEGVNIAANAVKATLGPKGRNVLIESDRPNKAPHSTKDGVTVAKEIKLEDPEQNLGAALIREVASKQNDHSGDGTTTATVLAQFIVNQGNKVITAGANPMDVKRGMDIAVAKVVEALKGMKKDVTTTEEIAQVGTISANGETEIGKLVAEAMDKVGKEGVITVELSKSSETTLDVVEGLQFPQGYLSPHFINDVEKMRVEMENPVILFFNQKMKSLSTLLPLMEKVVTAQRPLLLVVEEIENEVLGTLVLNHTRGNIKVAVVKAPAYGVMRGVLLEDMAILTGGTVINEDSPIGLENVTLDMLGQADKVIITKDDCTLIGGKSDEERLFDRTAQIRTLLKSDVTPMEEAHLETRLAKLTGGIAVIRVGGATDVEVKERKDRVDDAIHATRAAVEEGIVAGGGSALIFASDTLTNLTDLDTDVKFGVDIIKRACQEPMRQIARNAGVENDASIVTKVMEDEYVTFGYNAQTGKFCNMFDAGIIDPVKVVRTALQDATSVASLLLTTEVTITNKQDNNDNISKEYFRVS